MKFVLCLLVLVTLVSRYQCSASYLGYGGLVGDLTPRTGFAAPSTNFRHQPHGHFSGFGRGFVSRVRRAEPNFGAGRPREGKFVRGFGGPGGWRQNPGAGVRGSYPRTAPASSSYGR
jgi:hypothetical protein